jgi:hypothetical protein
VSAAAATLCSPAQLLYLSTVFTDKIVFLGSTLLPVLWIRKL